MNTHRFSYSNTAFFWVFDADRSVSKYDTRLGRRWNVVPVDQVSISNYAVNGDKPILISDHLGDTTKVFNSKGKFIATIYDNKENAVLILNNKASVLSGIFLSQTSSNGFNLAKANKVATSLRKNGTGYAINDIMKWDKMGRSTVKATIDQYKNEIKPVNGTIWVDNKLMMFVPGEFSSDLVNRNGLIRPIFRFDKFNKSNNLTFSPYNDIHSHPADHYVSWQNEGESRSSSVDIYTQDPFQLDRNSLIGDSRKVATTPTETVIYSKDQKNDIHIDKSNWSKPEN